MYIYAGANYPFGKALSSWSYFLFLVHLCMFCTVQISIALLVVHNIKIKSTCHILSYLFPMFTVYSYGTRGKLGLQVGRSSEENCKKKTEWNEYCCCHNKGEFSRENTDAKKKVETFLAARRTTSADRHFYLFYI